MDCYCNSKQLYMHQKQRLSVFDGKQLSEQRVLSKESDKTQVFDKTIDRIIEASSIYLPTFIQTVSYSDIVDNPLWFHKQFISKNIPCKITDGFSEMPEMLAICEKWNSPKDFLQDIQKIGIKQVSTSITPDGFADSIKNKYFVQPYETKLQFKDIIDWGIDQQNKKNKIKKQEIPYIQHQNSNLTEQLNKLYQSLDHDARNNFSHKFFNGKMPDAQNFWMGFPESVSSLHKDPYQNFYSVVTGEKHFSLLPPISILYLQQNQFINSRYNLSHQSHKLQISSNKQISKTRWISCNPDLQSDYTVFPNLAKLKQWNFHIILQAGQMLYLPALWYHQVSQSNTKDTKYTIAINYWFDMEFNHNYALYETARSLKGYP